MKIMLISIWRMNDIVGVELSMCDCHVIAQLRLPLRSKHSRKVAWILLNADFGH